MRRSGAFQGPMRALALCLLIAAAVTAAPAHAVSEPPWFRRDIVSSPHAFVTDPVVGFTRDNTVLAAWSWQDGERLGASAAAHVLGRDSVFGPQRPLPAGRVGGPLLSGRSSAVIAVLRPAGSNRDPRSTLRVAFGTATGAFGRERIVSRDARIARPALAGNDRGDLALAWFEDRGVRNDRVSVALRRGGGGFGAPVRLATGRIRNVAAAVGPAGHVLVAWEARGVVRARFKRPGARRFGPVETVRSEPAFGTDLHAEVARSGRGYLAWSAQRRTEGGETGPVFIEAVTRRPGGRFGRAQLLERLGRERTQRPVDLEVDSSGHALMGWTGRRGDAERPRLGASRDSGRFTILDVQSVGGTEGVFADVATGRGGRRMALWISEHPGSKQLVSSIDDPRSKGFQRTEPASEFGDVHSARGAFSPRGLPVATYVGDDDRVRVAYHRG